MADSPSPTPSSPPQKPPVNWETVKGAQALWSLIAGLSIALVSGTVFIVTRYNSVTNRIEKLEDAALDKRFEKIENRISDLEHEPSASNPSASLAFDSRIKSLEDRLNKLPTDSSPAAKGEKGDKGDPGPAGPQGPPGPSALSSSPSSNPNNANRSAETNANNPSANPAADSSPPKPLATLDADGIHYAITSLTQESGELILRLTALASTPPRSDVQFTATPAYYYDGSTQTKWSATSVSQGDEAGTSSIRIHFLPNTPVKITFHFQSPAEKLSSIPELQIRAGASKPTFNNLPVASAP